MMPISRFHQYGFIVILSCFFLYSVDARYSDVYLPNKLYTDSNRIISDYGSRTRGMNYHAAIDYKSEYGTNIEAIFGGTILDSDYGLRRRNQLKWISISNPKYGVMRYLHLFCSESERLSSILTTNMLQQRNIPADVQEVWAVDAWRIGGKSEIGNKEDQLVIVNFSTKANCKFERGANRVVVENGITKTNADYHVVAYNSSDLRETVFQKVERRVQEGDTEVLYYDFKAINNGQTIYTVKLARSDDDIGEVVATDPNYFALDGYADQYFRICYRILTQFTKDANGLWSKGSEFRVALKSAGNVNLTVDELVDPAGINNRTVIATSGGSGATAGENDHPHLHVEYVTNNVTTSPLALYSYPNPGSSKNNPYPINRWLTHISLNSGNYVRNAWQPTDIRSVYRVTHQNDNKNAERLVFNVESAPAKVQCAGATNGVDLNAVYLFLTNVNNFNFNFANDSSLDANINNELIKSIRSCNLLARFSSGGRGEKDGILKSPNNTGYRIKIGVENEGGNSFDFNDTGENGVFSIPHDYDIEPTPASPGRKTCDDSLGHNVYILNKWDSKISKDRKDANGNAIYARINAEAQYPDGNYYIVAKTKSILHRDNPKDCDGEWDSKKNSYHKDNFNNAGDDFVNTDERRKIVIDNFAPYIEEVKILKGGNLIANQKWIYVADALVLKNMMAPETDPKFIFPQDGFVIEIYYSEYMQHSTYNIPSLRLLKQLVPPATTSEVLCTINTAGAQWANDEQKHRSKLLVPVSAGISDTTYKGYAILAISRQTKDINDNSLDIDPATVAYRSTSGWKNLDSSFSVAARMTSDDEHFSFFYGNRNEGIAYVENIQMIRKGLVDIPIIHFDTKYQGGEATILYNLRVNQNQENITLSSMLTENDKNRIRGNSFQFEPADRIRINLGFNAVIKKDSNKPRLVFIKNAGGSTIEKTLEPNVSVFPEVKDWYVEFPLAEFGRLSSINEFYIQFDSPEEIKTAFGANLNYDGNPFTTPTKEIGINALKYFIPVKHVPPMIAKVHIEREKMTFFLQEMYNDNGVWATKKSSLSMKSGDYSMKIYFIDPLLRQENTNPPIRVKNTANNMVLNQTRQNTSWQNGSYDLEYTYSDGKKKNIKTPVIIWSEEFSIPENSDVDGTKIKIQYGQRYSDISASSQNPLVPSE